MKRFFIVLALVAFTVTGAKRAFAEISLDAVGWQRKASEKSTRKAVWSDVETSAFDTKAPLLRGKALLKNRGPNAAEGVLVRYVVTARLVSAVPGRASEAAWALPFLIDERRVPKVKSNSLLEVPLSLSPKLDLYLAKLKRLGFKANALKLQVMVEPHSDASVRIVEANLEGEL